MNSKSEVLYSVGVLNDSLSAVEQAVLGMEEEFHRHGNQQALLIGQGQTMTKALGELTAAVGQLTDRLGRYLEDADRQGGRINALERDVRELKADA